LASFLDFRLAAIRRALLLYAYARMKLRLQHYFAIDADYFHFIFAFIATNRRPHATASISYYFAEKPDFDNGH
jgi:hypothetical protein